MFTGLGVTVIAFNPQLIGQVLIVDCTLDVPTSENHLVGDSLILHCSINISITDDVLVNFIWSTNNTIVERSQTRRTQDHYFIPQLNTSDDGQVYQCEVFLNTTPPVMTNGIAIYILNLNGESFKEMIKMCMHTYVANMSTCDIHIMNHDSGS